jgi:hypothetical protein
LGPPLDQIAAGGPGSVSAAVPPPLPVGADAVGPMAGDMAVPPIGS